MPAAPQTKPGTRKLSNVCRKVVAPSGIVSTGWPAVAHTCKSKLGIDYDDWQHGAGRLILAKRADGKLAAMIGGVGISICRQAGKTYLIGGMVFGLSVNRPGLLTIWSAHHARTHGETFLAMQEFAKRRQVAPYVKQVFTGSGDEEIRFQNGSRILFGARERGFGRGMPGVDVIVADEAQIMSEKALDAQLATVNTSDFGLVIYIGTPPRPDDSSEAFTRMRTEAWSGTLRDAAWIEIGAEPGSDPGDPKAWKANPSHPHRTPAESILRLKRKLTPDSFLREGLGIWPDDADTRERVLDLDGWDAMLDREVALAGGRALAVSMTWDRSQLSIAAASGTGDGRLEVEVGYHGPSADAALRMLVSLVERWDPCALVIDAGDQAMTLHDPLIAAGIEPDVTTAGEYLLACGNFIDSAKASRLVHTGDPLLHDQIDAAGWRKLLGGRVWQDRTEVDVSALKAAALAVDGMVRFGSRVQAGATAPAFQQPSETSDELDLMTAGF